MNAIQMLIAAILYDKTSFLYNIITLKDATAYSALEMPSISGKIKGVVKCVEKFK